MSGIILVISTIITMVILAVSPIDKIKTDKEVIDGIEHQMYRDKMRWYGWAAAAFIGGAILSAIVAIC